MKSCKLILLGCGDFGRKRLSASTEIPNLDMIAVYDTNITAAQQCANITKSKVLERFEDIDKLDYDGVILSTTNDSHLTLCQYFTEKKKYILCEAPLVKSIAQLDTLRNLERDRLSLIKPASPILYHPAIDELLKLLSKDALGKIYLVKISLGHNHEETKYSWKTESAIAGGGALMDLGPSVISIVNLFGKVEKFEVTTKNFSGDCEVDDYAYGHFELDNNILVHFETDWNKWNNNQSIIVEGELGSLKLPLHGKHLILTTHDGEVIRIPYADSDNELKKEVSDFTTGIQKQTSYLSSISDQIYVLPTILRKAS